MNTLVVVLRFKIAFTLVAWIIPSLFFPTSVMAWLGFPVPEPVIWLRLLGMAFTALVVCYWFGFREARRGQHPVPVVWTGIVSNGGASLILLFFGLSGAWAAWGWCAQGYMWGSLAGTSVVTAGLVFADLIQPSARK